MQVQILHLMVRNAELVMEIDVQDVSIPVEVIVLSVSLAIILKY